MIRQGIAIFGAIALIGGGTAHQRAADQHQRHSHANERSAVHAERQASYVARATLRQP